MRVSAQFTIAVFILVFITVFFYWIDITRERIPIVSPSKIEIAKPDWYVSNMEWQPAIVLYNGENYYYSHNSGPK